MPDLKYRFEIYEETLKSTIYRICVENENVDRAFDNACAVVARYERFSGKDTNYSIVSKFGELKL